MTVQIVSLRLKPCGRDYSELYRRIGSYQRHIFFGAGMWALATQQTSGQVRDFLVEAIDGDDEIIVFAMAARASLGR